jgi:hypothetical protein
MSNRKEFVSLKEKYKSFSLEEIEVAWKEVELQEEEFVYGFDVANYMTGFGDGHTCSLCESAGQDCYDCFWRTSTNCGCNTGENSKTYSLIYEARNPKQLKKAFEARVKLMAKVIKACDKEER